MTYSIPPRKVPGDTISSSEINTYIKANFAEGVPDKFTAKGELPFGDGSKSIDILSPGTDTHFLISQSGQATGSRYGLLPSRDMVQAQGDLILGSASKVVGRLPIGGDADTLVSSTGETLGWAWADLSAHATYIMGSSNTPPYDTITIINYNTSKHDPASCVTTGSNWKYTAPSDGIYLVSLTWGVPECPLGSSSHAWYIYKNGTSLANVSPFVYSGIKYSREGCVATAIPLESGDYIDIRYWHSYYWGITINDQYRNHIDIARLV